MERERLLEDLLKQLVTVANMILADPENLNNYNNLYFAAMEAEKFLAGESCEGDNCRL